MAVIALPLVLLLAVIGPEARQRWERADGADRAARASEEVVRLASGVDALQAERVLAAAHRAGADSVGGALQDQVARTDDAVGRAVEALEALPPLGRSVAVAAARARARLLALDEARASAPARAEGPWVDPYAPAIGALLDLQDALGATADDLGGGGGLLVAALLARTKEAAASQGAQVAAAAAWGELRGGQAATLTQLRADEAATRTAYLAASPTAVRVARRDEVSAGAATGAGRYVDVVVAGEPIGALGTWLDLSAGRREVLSDAEAARVAEATSSARAAEVASRRSSSGFLALAGGSLIVVLGLALAAARSITRPLDELTRAADQLASDRLPKLVDALRHPVDGDEAYLAAAMQSIRVQSDDELGHLAQAFNAVQAVAVDVAAEQATLLKKGISDLYVNLARRNQALIDRQIHLLDQLESDEQDPAVLEHLYLLDHLATRMRRNAESLLVLAGAESGPRRSRSVVGGRRGARRSERGGGVRAHRDRHHGGEPRSTLPP